MISIVWKRYFIRLEGLLGIARALFIRRLQKSSEIIFFYEKLLRIREETLIVVLLRHGSIESIGKARETFLVLRRLEGRID